MGGLYALLAIAVSSVTYGWQSDGNGGVKYIVQVPPHQLEQLRSSGEITSAIDPSVQGRVTSVVIRVGNEKVPREAISSVVVADDRARVPVPAIHPIDLVSGRGNITLPRSTQVMKPDPQGGMTLPSLGNSRGQAPAGNPGAAAGDPGAAASNLLREMQNKAAAAAKNAGNQASNRAGQMADRAQGGLNTMTNNMLKAMGNNASPNSAAGQKQDTWYDMDSKRGAPSTGGRAPMNPPVGPPEPPGLRSRGNDLRATLANNRTESNTNAARSGVGTLPANLSLPRNLSNQGARLPSTAPDPLKNLRSSPSTANAGGNRSQQQLESEYDYARSRAGSYPNGQTQDSRMTAQDSLQSSPFARMTNSQRSNLPSTSRSGTSGMQQYDPGLYGSGTRGAQQPYANAPAGANRTQAGMMPPSAPANTQAASYGNNLAAQRLPDREVDPRLSKEDINRLPQNGYSFDTFGNPVDKYNRIIDRFGSPVPQNRVYELTVGRNNPAIKVGAGAPFPSQPNLGNIAQTSSVQPRTGTRTGMGVPASNASANLGRPSINLNPNGNTRPPSVSDSQSNSTSAKKSPVNSQMLNVFLVASILGNFFLMWWLKGLHDRYRDMVATKRMATTTSMA